MLPFFDFRFNALRLSPWLHRQMAEAEQGLSFVPPRHRGDGVTGVETGQESGSQLWVWAVDFGVFAPFLPGWQGSPWFWRKSICQDFSQKDHLWVPHSIRPVPWYMDVFSLNLSETLSLNWQIHWLFGTLLGSGGDRVSTCFHMFPLEPGNPTWGHLIPRIHEQPRHGGTPLWSQVDVNLKRLMTG